MGAHEAETRQFEALVDAGEPNLALRLLVIRRFWTLLAALSCGLMLWLTGLPASALAALARLL